MSNHEVTATAKAAAVSAATAVQLARFKKELPVSCTSLSSRLHSGVLNVTINEERERSTKQVLTSFMSQNFFLN